MARSGRQREAVARTLRRASDSQLADVNYRMIRRARQAGDVDHSQTLLRGHPELMVRSDGHVWGRGSAGAFGRSHAIGAIKCDEIEGRRAVALPTAYGFARGASNAVEFSEPQFVRYGDR